MIAACNGPQDPGWREQPWGRPRETLVPESANGRQCPDGPEPRTPLLARPIASG